MSTCCPNCSADAFGTEAASLCTECATATVAGGSFSLPVLLAAALAVGVGVIASRALRRRPGGRGWTKQPALG